MATDSDIEKQLSEEITIELGSVEKSLLFLGTTSTILLIAAQIMFYYAFASRIVITSNYMQYVIYLVISIVFIGLSAWYIKHHRRELSCSSSMMVGMIIGMISGFLIGAIVAASNGMFMGSVVGVFTGMGISAWNVRCCGTMSVLEGMMAGLMSGVMGAMTTVMMISDNLFLFLPILVGSSVSILVGMLYMVYEETVEKKHSIKSADNYHLIGYVTAMFLFSIFITSIILWGPRSVLTAGL